MHEPAMGAGLCVLAIASAVDPEAFASLIFDAEVVTHGSKLSIALPPFTKDAFWPVRAFHPPAYTPPRKGNWRVVW
jgi:hypothetical protein